MVKITSLFSTLKQFGPLSNKIIFNHKHFEVSTQPHTVSQHWTLVKFATQFLVFDIYNKQNRSKDPIDTFANKCYLISHYQSNIRKGNKVSKIEKLRYRQWERGKKTRVIFHRLIYFYRSGIPISFRCTNQASMTSSKNAEAETFSLQLRFPRPFRMPTW